uniref:Putative secreted protein n=1 Tax=Anopheles darlingi TaxID=43151 RepID=A0A2M4DJ36_ANODA
MFGVAGFRVRSIVGGLFAIGATACDGPVAPGVVGGTLLAWLLLPSCFTPWVIDSIDFVISIDEQPRGLRRRLMAGASGCSLKSKRNTLPSTLVGAAFV